MQNIGKIILVIGIILVIVGLVIWFFGSKFGWFGNLPGDIRIKRENFQFYMPIASMILISVIITIILWLIRKFFL